MSKLEFLVVLEKDEDGYIVAECPSLPGCVSQGKDTQEAMLNIQDAIKGIMAVRKEKGLPIPEVEVAKVQVVI